MTVFGDRRSVGGFSDAHLRIERNCAGRRAGRARAARAGGTFSVGEPGDAAQAPAAGRRCAPIVDVDALIALQGVEDPRERKKRAVAQGRNALDVLDALKLGLLDGSVDRRRWRG